MWTRLYWSEHHVFSLLSGQGGFYQHIGLSLCYGKKTLSSSDKESIQQSNTNIIFLVVKLWTALIAGRGFPQFVQCLNAKNYWMQLLNWSVISKISTIIFIVRLSITMTIKVAIITFVIVLYAFAQRPMKKSLFNLLCRHDHSHYHNQAYFCLTYWERRTDHILYAVCVFNIWDLKLRSNLEAKSHWLHLYDFTPEWIFKWLLKLPAWTDA